nr:MAG TPA: hypothetical protein [Caudoviricetes sp.]
MIGLNNNFICLLRINFLGRLFLVLKNCLCVL